MPHGSISEEKDFESMPVLLLMFCEVPILSDEQFLSRSWDIAGVAKLDLVDV
jgi:hypothetical protein